MVQGVTTEMIPANRAKSDNAVLHRLAEVVETMDDADVKLIARTCVEEDNKSFASYLVTLLSDGTSARVYEKNMSRVPASMGRCSPEKVTKFRHVSPRFWRMLIDRLFV